VTCCRPSEVSRTRPRSPGMRALAAENAVRAVPPPAPGIIASFAAVGANALWLAQNNPHPPEIRDGP
jgi:hypothetical protein